MSLWESSFELMFLGMGSVFVFLVLLVLSTIALSFLVNKISPDNTVEAKASDKNIIAIATVAFMQHKKSKIL
jgi:Na+-transporting methylmalonyl-CoA/oxaloacetate decarboxylase gamma subunit